LKTETITTDRTDSAINGIIVVVVAAVVAVAVVPDVVGSLFANRHKSNPRVQAKPKKRTRTCEIFYLLLTIAQIFL